MQDAFAGQIVGVRPMKDPIVAEVRRARMAHTRKFGGDLGAICQDLKDAERRLALRMVRLTAGKTAAHGRAR